MCTSRRLGHHRCGTYVHAWHIHSIGRVVAASILDLRCLPSVCLWSSPVNSNHRRLFHICGNECPHLTFDQTTIILEWSWHYSFFSISTSLLLSRADNFICPAPDSHHAASIYGEGAKAIRRLQKGLWRAQVRPSTLPILTQQDLKFQYHRSSQTHASRERLSTTIPHSPARLPTPTNHQLHRQHEQPQ